MSFTCDFKCPKCKLVSPDVPTSVKDQWCPHCGEPMNKVYAVPTVLFNGNGWTPKFHNGDKEKK